MTKKTGIIVAISVGVVAAVSGTIVYFVKNK